MVFHKNKSVTLIELIIAVSLVGIIILGINSISIFSRYQVISSDRRAKLQNEVSYTLEHMTKKISLAIGDKSNNPIELDIASPSRIRVRTDSNHNGVVDAADDKWIGYRQNGSQIVYCPDDDGSGTCSDPEVVSSGHILTTGGLVFTRLADDNNVEITVNARWNPDPDVPVSQDNPAVTMQTSVNLPSVSTN